MGKRHTDALYINWGGASNPAGIARSLVAAIDEARAEGEWARTDPAVRLMVHHLCHLLGIPTSEAEPPGFCYRVEIDACAARATDQALEALKLHRPILGAVGSASWNEAMRTDYTARAAAERASA